MTDNTRICPICDGVFTVKECPIDGVPTIGRKDLEVGGDTLAPGRTLAGRYRILKRLGRGGMGQVYLASQVSINRLVVLKTLHRAIQSDRTALRRFYQEARAAAALNHPNIVHVHDFGVDDVTGTPFITMEYLEGPSLATVLSAKGPFDQLAACRIVSGIAQALTEAHDKGVIHRDLKPANIHLQRLADGLEQVKVLDFGLAKVLGDVPTEDDPITKVGALMGTPQYMSPEQCRGLPVDYRGDLYALGCILYELMVGHPPFHGMAEMGILVAHLNTECPALPSPLHNGREPSPGVRVLYRALTAKAIGDRPRSTLGVANALAALAAGGVPLNLELVMDPVHQAWRFSAQEDSISALGSAQTEPPPTPMPVAGGDTTRNEKRPSSPNKGRRVGRPTTRAERTLAPAPTQGLVTFVFTEVAGAAALRAQLGDEFDPLFDLYEQIIRETMSRHGGYEVNADDDAFVVAFGRAKDAVGMCLAAQERLHAAPWPDSVRSPAVAKELGETPDGLFKGLRVRMGVHTGLPQSGLDPVTWRMGYSGDVMIRGLQTAQAAYGGQVVISHATWEAIDGAAVRAVITDLGKHALKGLERRERLYQVLPLSLAARQFPPLRTASLAGTNLRPRLDPFFGRDQELVDLAGRIEAGERLISVLGSGGTGKTRFSQHFGATQLDVFPGGVWFCDLTESRNITGITTATASAFNLALTAVDHEAQLADAIAGMGRALYLLDNFEQVVAHAPETVGKWIQSAPEAVFIVTTRTRLHVAGETVFHLDPLPPTEAMALFYDRGARASPGFEETEDNRPIVQEIVERLDCVALAIELAAARVRVLPPEHLLERLGQRFQLLRSARRDFSGRQATLRGAIDWSWALLQPWEQTALTQMSVFRGGSTFEAAEAVLDLEAHPGAPWALDVLEALVDHSLIRVVSPQAGHTRYRLLESIREYAHEKLGDDADAALRRHAEHFATYGTPAQLNALETHGCVARRTALCLDSENIVAGWAHSLATGQVETAAYCSLAAERIFSLIGPFSEGLSVIEKIPHDTLDAQLQARLLSCKGVLLDLIGQRTQAFETYSRALDLARVGGDRRLVGRLIRRRAWVNRVANAEMTRLEDLQDALRISVDVGDLTGEGQARGYLGGMAIARGDMKQGFALRKAALELFQKAGNRYREAAAWSNLGVWYSDRGEHQEAVRHTERALGQHQEMRNRRSEAICQSNLGLYFGDLGDFGRALDHLALALELTRATGMRRLQAHTQGRWGDVLVDQGDDEAAEARFLASIELADDIGNPLLAGMARGSLAAALGRRGELETARALFRIASDAVRGASAFEYAKIQAKWAEVEGRVGDVAVARAALGEAEAIIHEMALLPEAVTYRIAERARRVLEEAEA